MLTYDQVVGSVAKGLSEKVVMPIDFSAGADAIVASGDIKSVADFKGKKGNYAQIDIHRGHALREHCAGSLWLVNLSHAPLDGNDDIGNQFPHGLDTGRRNSGGQRGGDKHWWHGGDSGSDVGSLSVGIDRLVDGRIDQGHDRHRLQAEHELRGDLPRGRQGLLQG